MGNKVTDELVATVRSIVGGDYSDMDIIRALHMANNDATAAINIIFDTRASAPRATRQKIGDIRTFHTVIPGRRPELSPRSLITALMRPKIDLWSRVHHMALQTVVLK
ncbi:hypothetical protein NMG60_11033326 [Bertholletia excelsa]